MPVYGHDAKFIRVEYLQPPDLPRLWESYISCCHGRSVKDSISISNNYVT